MYYYVFRLGTIWNQLRNQNEHKFKKHAGETGGAAATNVKLTDEENVVVEIIGDTTTEGHLETVESQAVFEEPLMLM